MLVNPQQVNVKEPSMSLATALMERTDTKIAAQVEERAPEQAESVRPLVMAECATICSSLACKLMGCRAA